MKRLNKLFIILMCCIGTMSLASCLDNGDGGGIDPETYKSQLQMMSGSYYGYGTSWLYQNKIYFYNDTITDKNNTEQVDSVTGVVGTMAMDSTFTISGVPGRLLVKEISDEHKGLKEAIENAPDQTVKGVFVINSIGSTVYFLASAYTLTYPELTYDGETHHDVKIAFWGPAAGTFFVHNYTARVLSIPLFPAAVYEGETKVADLIKNVNNNTEASRGALNVFMTR